MKSLIKCLLIAILISVSVITVSALEPKHKILYFENRYILDNKPHPNICFHEPEKFNNAYDNETLFTITYLAINNWVLNLKNHTGTTDDRWDIELTYKSNSTSYGTLTQQHPYCDVNILWAGSPILNIDTGGFHKGFAKHYSGSKTQVDIVMFTWDYFPNGTDSNGIPIYRVVPADPYVTLSVLEHELGHAFGLKHSYYEGKLNLQSYNIDQSKRSIMYGLTDPFNNQQTLKSITKSDVYSIVAKYGTDGWGGMTNYDIFAFIEWK